MSMDLAGRRATRLAKVAVEAAILATVVLAIYVVSRGFVPWAAFPARPLLMSAAVLVPFVFLLTGLWCLRLFLRDVLAGQVFTARNARRLALLGWLFVAYALIRIVIAFAVGYTFVINVMIIASMLAQPALIMGLLVLVIAAAWRYGSELQQDRDLTV